MGLDAGATWAHERAVSLLNDAKLENNAKEKEVRGRRSCTLHPALIDALNRRASSSSGALSFM